MIFHKYNFCSKFFSLSANNFWAQKHSHRYFCSRTKNITGKRQHSVGSDQLVIPTAKLSTVDGSAFSGAVPRIWNSLSDDVFSADLLSSICHFCYDSYFLTLFSDKFVFYRAACNADAVL